MLLNCRFMYKIMSEKRNEGILEIITEISQSKLLRFEKKLVGRESFVHYHLLVT